MRSIALHVLTLTLTMHERFSVRPQLCFVVSFVLRVPGLEEGVMFGGKALGQMAGTLIWMPGAPGVRRANVPSKTWHWNTPDYRPWQHSPTPTQASGDVKGGYRYLKISEGLGPVWAVEPDNVQILEH